MSAPFSAAPPATAVWAQEPPPPIPWRAHPMGDLPDINVWLALAVHEHPHHAMAQRYWSQAQASGVTQLWFCRVTLLGLVRLLCQPKVVGEGALTLNAAWALYQQFLAVPGVGVLADPEGCDAQLGTLLSRAPLPARLWTDAYLAALAQSAGLRLVSFDADFHRFALPACLVLPTNLGAE